MIILPVSAIILNISFLRMLRTMKFDMHATFLEIHVPKYFTGYWTKRSYYKDIKGIHLYRGNLHFFEGKRNEYYFHFSPLTADKKQKYQEMIKKLREKDIPNLTRRQFYSFLFVSRGPKKKYTFDDDGGTDS
jgi:hypothetical protein